MSLIEIKNLCKSYGTTDIFKDVNYNIEKGDVVAIIGPSGTGKSTLMRCLNFLEEATSGEILLDGVNILAPGIDRYKINQRMGMVFQSFNLFPHLMVIENIMKPPMDLLGMTKEEAFEQAMSLLKEVGLSNKAYFFPDELSGGQKQRVAIARALAMKPEILLLDEPTSALDPRMVGEVMSVIRKLSNTGITMMIVTHEMRFARIITNKTIYMDEGGIYEAGPTEEIFGNPKKSKTKDFLSEREEFNYDATDSDFDLQSMIKGINVYGISNGTDNKLLSKLMLVAEELFVNLIFGNARAGNVEAMMNVAYKPDDETFKLNVFYTGESCNLLEDEEADELSVKIIEKSCKTIEHDFEGGMNILKMTIV